jgi:tetratricopeptide (TPR) repeat protein
VANIRVTTPLWADEVALWQWAHRQQPDAITPKSHLLTTYIARNDHVHARELADELLAHEPPCSGCLINIAFLALSEYDAARAALALGKLKDSRVLAYDKGILRGYVFANGMLLELQGDPSGAEEAYRDAIKLDPLDPVPQITLATLLAKHARFAEARPLANAALALFAPDERVRRQREFETALATAGGP